MYLHSSSAFEIEFAEAKAQHLKSAKQEIYNNTKITESSILKLKQRLNNIDTKAALWRPSAPYLATTEVILQPDESIAICLGGRDPTNTPLRLPPPSDMLGPTCLVWRALALLPGNILLVPMPGSINGIGKLPNLSLTSHSKLSFLFQGLGPGLGWYP